MKKILAFGTFDHLHPGHIYFLKEAKNLGDELHVIIALDETVKKVKKNFPRWDETKRIKEVSKISEVDFTYLGSPYNHYECLDFIKPDVIALGYDQRSFTDSLGNELRKRSLTTKIIRIDSYEPEKYKSSLL